MDKSRVKIPSYDAIVFHGMGVKKKKKKNPKYFIDVKRLSIPVYYMDLSALGK